MLMGMNVDTIKKNTEGLLGWSRSKCRED